MRDKLDGVNETLALVIRSVLKKAKPSLGFNVIVTEGVRTATRQAELLRIGATQVKNSRHLTGHAVDLAPVVDGQVRWDWPLFYRIAELVRDEAIAAGVELRWGGVWDRSLNALGNIEDEVASYVRRRKADGKSAFLDGPHFELPR